MIYTFIILVFLGYAWIYDYPFPEDSIEYFEQADQVIIIENNAISHFAQLIKLSTAYVVKDKILKYNGRCFSVEEVQTEIEKFIERGGRSWITNLILKIK